MSGKISTCSQLGQKYVLRDHPNCRDQLVQVFCDLFWERRSNWTKYTHSIAVVIFCKGNSSPLLYQVKLYSKSVSLQKLCIIEVKRHSDFHSTKKILKYFLSVHTKGLVLGWANSSAAYKILPNESRKCQLMLVLIKWPPKISRTIPPSVIEFLRNSVIRSTPQSFASPCMRHQSPWITMFVYEKK